MSREHASFRFASFIYALSLLFLPLIYAETVTIRNSFLNLQSYFFIEKSISETCTRLTYQRRKINELNSALLVVKSAVNYSDLRRLNETRTKIIIRMHLEFNTPGVISLLWKSSKISPVNSIIAGASMTFACTEYY
ncbi:hypothetical protein TcasGA2_TC000491 [Tribolium castaneum]|uniref:Uncharacterized protein n=1 Tax=Tribolium castaneum TaxID=7070 RepID=D6WA04_TRICA|nr:hypothetical protein TcasGA2_TC000491 [Tribolium castaneum]